MAHAAAYDPDNAHSTIYMWGTTGIGFNAAKVAERLGADAPTDSWALVFDPEVAAKLADCGISFLDSSSDMLPAALAWLGRDPTSSDPADLEAATEVLKAVRPYIRYFHSSQYINDLAKRTGLRRRGQGSRSLTPSPRRAPTSGSISSRFRRMRRIPTPRTPSSTS